TEPICPGFKFQAVRMIVGTSPFVAAFWVRAEFTEEPPVTLTVSPGFSVAARFTFPGLERTCAEAIAEIAAEAASTATPPSKSLWIRTLVPRRGGRARGRPSGTADNGE